MKCKCGCGGEAQYLMTGVDYDGERFIKFVDEPACSSAATYCEEAAHEDGLPFSKRRILSLDRLDFFAGV